MGSTHGVACGPHSSQALRVSLGERTAGCVANGVVPVEGQDTSFLSDDLRWPVTKSEVGKVQGLQHC